MYTRLGPTLRCINLFCLIKLELLLEVYFSLPDLLSYPVLYYLPSPITVFGFLCLVLYPLLSSLTLAGTLCKFSHPNRFSIFFCRFLNFHSFLSFQFSPFFSFFILNQLGLGPLVSSFVLHFPYLFITFSLVYSG